MENRFYHEKHQQQLKRQKKTLWFKQTLNTKEIKRKKWNRYEMKWRETSTVPPKWILEMLTLFSFFLSDFLYGAWCIEIHMILWHFLNTYQTNSIPIVIVLFVVTPTPSCAWCSFIWCDAPQWHVWSLYIETETEFGMLATFFSMNKIFVVYNIQCCYFIDEIPFNYYFFFFVFICGVFAFVYKFRIRFQWSGIKTAGHPMSTTIAFKMYHTK